MEGELRHPGLQANPHELMLFNLVKTLNAEVEKKEKCDWLYVERQAEYGAKEAAYKGFWQYLPEFKRLSDLACTQIPAEVRELSAHLDFSVARGDWEIARLLQRKLDEAIAKQKGHGPAQPSDSDARHKAGGLRVGN